MKSSLIAFYSIVLFTLLSSQSCTDSAPPNNDLAEYGYKGKVKELKVQFYYDFVELNGQVVVDNTKIESIRTMNFNKDGNLDVVVTTYPDSQEEKETVYYQFTDGRKSSFYIFNPSNDTLQKATYEWISDREYKFTSVFNTGRKLKSWSNLNEDYRDLSGGYTFTDGDSIFYSKSYENTVFEENLIKETISTDELTGEQSTIIMKYSDFDSKGNPQRVEMFEGDGKTPINLAIREFSYY